jgi:regulator of replication initiation timing
MSFREYNFNKVALLVQITGLTNDNFRIVKENQQLKLENRQLKEQLESAVEHFLREKEFFCEELIAAKAKQPHTQGPSASLTGFFEPQLVSRKRPIEGETWQLPNAKRHQEEAASTSIAQTME